ncbi:unnamed protein product [Lampetra fluviatilis]
MTMSSVPALPELLAKPDDAETTQRRDYVRALHKAAPGTDSKHTARQKHIATPVGSGHLHVCGRKWRETGRRGAWADPERRAQTRRQARKENTRLKSFGQKFAVKRRPSSLRTTSAGNLHGPLRTRQAAWRVGETPGRDAAITPSCCWEAGIGTGDIVPADLAATQPRNTRARRCYLSSRRGYLRAVGGVNGTVGGATCAVGGANGISGQGL